MSGHNAILRDGNENRQPGDHVCPAVFVKQTVPSRRALKQLSILVLQARGNRRRAIINLALGRITFPTFFFFKETVQHSPHMQTEVGIKVDLCLIHQTEINVIPWK